MQHRSTLTNAARELRDAMEAGEYRPNIDHGDQVAAIDDAIHQEQQWLVELCEEHNRNDWGGGEQPDNLADARYAVVVQQEGGDTWIDRADTVADVANIMLGCLTGTQGYDEWIDAVYDLDTRTQVSFTSRTQVTVQIGDDDAIGVAGEQLGVTR